FPVEPAQRFVSAGTPFQQSMIDDAAVGTVAAFDRDDMPGAEVAASDLISGYFEVAVAVPGHRRDSSFRMFAVSSSVVGSGRTRQKPSNLGGNCGRRYT